ncbi:hypothetical protein TWF718_001541 [Orbilia javanica]|uniref:Uncharacterized protein n=1 Tax=Orbilia javanica TaxID=47235 RepID=A0AAN8MVH1_9PEZI
MNVMKVIKCNNISFQTVSIDILHLDTDFSKNLKKRTLVFFHAFMEEDSACNYTIQELVFPQIVDDETRSILASLYALQACLIFLESVDITLNVPHNVVVSKLQQVFSQQPDITAGAECAAEETDMLLCENWRKLAKVLSVFRLLGAFINIQARDARDVRTLEVYNKIASLYMGL